MPYTNSDVFDQVTDNPGTSVQLSWLAEDAKFSLSLSLSSVAGNGTRGKITTVYALWHVYRAPSGCNPEHQQHNTCHPRLNRLLPKKAHGAVTCLPHGAVTCLPNGPVRCLPHGAVTCLPHGAATCLSHDLVRQQNWGLTLMALKPSTAEKTRVTKGSSALMPCPHAAPKAACFVPGASK